MSVEELNRYLDEYGKYGNEFNIETVTFEQSGRWDLPHPLTIDFKNYIGDRSEIKDELFEYSKEYLTQKLEDELVDIPHWTVTFNNCEKWGIHTTIPYVELTISYEFSKSRKDRNRIIFIENFDEDGGFIERLTNDELNNVDEKSGTPICLIDSETYNSHKNRHSEEKFRNDIRSECYEFITSTMSKFKVSHMDELKVLRDEFKFYFDNLFQTKV